MKTDIAAISFSQTLVTSPINKVKWEKCATALGKIIAGTTESWLSERFRSDAVQPSGYSFYHCDRRSGNGGGRVLLLVSLYLEHEEHTLSIQAQERSICNPTLDGSVILVYRILSALRQKTVHF